jgi:putative ABC transport system substrate-binding protein
VYPLPEFAVAGGLMSYGADSRDMYRQAGIYAARILKGAKPAELPIMQASKLELVFNVGVAKKIGLNVSRDFMARVDRVID